MKAKAVSAADFLPPAPLGGEMGDRMREVDWAATPLGPPEGWSQALRLTLGLILASGFPMALRWGPELVILYNDAYAPILGDKHPRALGQRFADIWPEVSQQLMPVQEEQIAGQRGAIFTEDMPVSIRRHGSALEAAWFTVSYSPVPDDTSPTGVGGIMATAVETTNRVLTERALRASEERYELALEAAGAVGTWNWDIPADKVYADERFARLYNVEPVAAANGEPIAAFFDAIVPEDRPRVEAAILTLLEKGGDFAEEYRVSAADGQVHWIFARGRCYLDAQGRPLRFPGVVVDLTDRRTAEERLVMREEQLRLATEAGDVGFWDVDLQNDTLEWSERTREMFGLRANVPLTLDDFYAGLHPADLVRAAEAFGRAINPDIRDDYDIEYRTVGLDDKVERWVAAKGRAIFAADGTPLRAIGSTRDITERKKAEEHLRLMVNELNHRVKNSLASVQAVAAQTFRGATSLSQAKEAFTARLIAMSEAHDILTDENWEGADLSDVVAAAARLLAGEERHRFIAHGPYARLSPKTALSLAMALHELGTNAVKYGALSTPNGKVSVRWSVEGRDAGRRLQLVWTESGGPAVTPPKRRGFGSRLMERGLAAELSGQVTLTFDPAGVVCTIDAPLVEEETPPPLGEVS
ncbi:PAS domain-containing protein [Caulobacter segnis]|uniref:PAS domain-containing sensor histidine kinase n=1 Tax=Caulobacter segnis TaxID=88688 RepID=UPI00240EB632|nr:PAS domain-containing protein [Caulobacter segnis]MDG2520845.1 PAS domain-containing protein [Caulobacter segnis]